METFWDVVAVVGANILAFLIILREGDREYKRQEKFKK